MFQFLGGGNVAIHFCCWHGSSPDTKESNHAAIHKLKVETEGQNEILCHSDAYHKKWIRGLSK